MNFTFNRAALGDFQCGELEPEIRGGRKFAVARSGMTLSKERQEPVGGWDVQLSCSPSKYHTMQTILFQTFSSAGERLAETGKTGLVRGAFGTRRTPRCLILSRFS